MQKIPQNVIRSPFHLPKIGMSFFKKKNRTLFKNKVTDYLIAHVKSSLSILITLAAIKFDEIIKK